MTRNAALTVRLPGARIAPAKSTWTYGHTRLENSGMNGFSRCSIMAGRVRIITSLWRTGDDRTLPLLSHKWIKSSLEKLSDNSRKGSFRTPERGHNEAASVVSAPFVPPNTSAQGCQRDLSDSFWKDNSAKFSGTDSGFQ